MFLVTGKRVRIIDCGNHTFLIIMFNAIKYFFYKSISKKDFI